MGAIEGMNNNQRVGSISNAHVGRDFENEAWNYFRTQQIILEKSFSIPCGVVQLKKSHTFDLGCNSDSNGKVIVECKSHKWTINGLVPIAKITIWNEAMYYFLLTPEEFKKIFFILKDFHERRSETLGEYYIKKNGHLRPYDVEILEFDNNTKTVKTLKHPNIADYY